MKATGWLKGLEVTADGTGIVSHAGVALLRALAGKTGLTAGLSKALANDRLLVHDRGQVLHPAGCLGGGVPFGEGRRRSQLQGVRPVD